MGSLVALRRTQSEIDVFGGDVYIDIDGKNVGIIRRQNLRFDLSAGKHTIKMYKSHTMGTFVGVAETQVEIGEEEKLYVRYSAPLMVNQPGNIVLAPYESESDLEIIIGDIEKRVHNDFAEQELKTEQEKKESQKSNTAFIIWLVVIPIVLFVLYEIVSLSYYW